MAGHTLITECPDRIEPIDKKSFPGPLPALAAVRDCPF
jgi:hypothetical protein